MDITRRLLLDAAAGAVAGAAATVPMSLLMWGAQRAGWMGEQPPRKITDEAVEVADETVDADVDPPQPARQGLTALNHLAFGAVAGIPFALVHRLFPAPLARVPAGAAYGVGVWASAYLGWLPALGIMPPADRDRPGRPASMIAAHLVYGSVLSAGLRLLRPVRA